MATKKKENGIGKIVIARTARAGVFAGTLARRDGMEVELTDARRLWYWSGAASLSSLAVSGLSNPSGCKFPVKVPRVVLLELIELLEVSADAWASIEAVPVWKA